MNQPLSLPFSFTFFSLSLIMACSKIFSGDLPEITNYIIQYLRNDLKSLYSCVLVNRFLCRIAIPILWEDPFSVKACPRNFLDTYLLFFNENDKTKLKEFGITIKSPSLKRPLFNYPSFIKTLNTYRAELHTINWINYLDYTNTKSTCSTNFTNQVILDKTIFFPIREETVKIKRNLLNPIGTKDFICILLFKLFIYSNASLKNFIIIYNFSYGHFFSKIYESIFENPKFISDIENFTFSCFDFNPIQPFLTFLPSSLSSIKRLNIY